MYLKMLAKDYKRKKVITIVLVVFMLLAAVLAAAGTRMFLALNGAMDNLFTKSNISHYVQMHTGTYDEGYVQQWTSSNPYIKEWSHEETLHPADVNLYLNKDSEKMDIGTSGIYFIVQNNDIDILLDLENERISVADDNIAVPIYFMEQENMKIGDTLTIKYTGYEKSFTISDFIRDSQYGNVTMEYKRFILSDRDYKEMESTSTDVEIVFSFVLKDETMLGDFTRSFQESNMPQNNYGVDIELFRLSHGIADGIVIGLVLLCSMLLILILFLTLRYTILSNIEEDFREIGVMKGIGFKLSSIIKFYLSKYLYLSAVACILGFILGQPLSDAMNTNLLLHLGTPDNDITGILASLGSTVLIFILVLSFCLLTLRRIGKMTVIDAIRMGNMGETYGESKLFALTRHRFTSVNMFIGLKDIFMKLKSYILLFLVFFICTFLCILPINVKNTIAAPDFISYMGIIKSDIIAVTVPDSGNAIFEMLEKDMDVLEWEAYTGEYYQVKDIDGKAQKVSVTVGNHAAFELKYSSGNPPVMPNEVALSYPLSKDLGKDVGDSIIMEIDGEDKYLLVSGIYQQTNNGGRAILACFEQDYENTYYMNINFNVKGNIEEKVNEYQELFKDIKIYAFETMSSRYVGGIVEQINSVSILIALIALLVSALITALFIKMLTAKEVSQIAVMKSIGFTHKHIRTQYFTRIGTILIIAITAGTLAANILGEKILNLVTGSMGAVGIKFIIKPVEVYMIYPLTLLAAVSITVIVSCLAIRKITVSQINAE